MDHFGLSRRQVLVGAVGAMLGAGAASRAAESPPQRRPNILFIAVDDLRPQLGCYGHAMMRSPAIDALAKRGALFERAYCQQAVCAPSRASLMTGCRPDTTKIYDLEHPLRQTMPQARTLAQHFREAGYAAESCGKIYHHQQDDFPQGWSAKPWHPGGPQFALQENRDLLARQRQEAKDAGKDPTKVRGVPVESAEVPDDAYPDGKIAAEAVRRLAVFKAAGTPFFLAVGFHRPHLPFCAPKRYWDLYDPKAIKLADNPFAPKGAPAIAMHNWGELRAYHGIPARGALSDEQARRLIHGYYASVSYMDAQLARVLAALDAQGLRDDTVIVLWGDHGWNLGEHGLWCKHANFETSVHAPLIFAGPGVRPGTRSRALVEFVDVFPTLCDLTGLDKPATLEGTSALPLFEGPDRPWKRAAFSQYPRGNVMGHSMRTDTHRLTRWVRKDGAVVGTELYDHRTDPAENENVAERPENAGLVKELAGWMEAGWRGARAG